MNSFKPQYTPSADWRQQFEFKVQYPTPHADFKLDPILKFPSTIKEPNRTISTP